MSEYCVLRILDDRHDIIVYQTFPILCPLTFFFSRLNTQWHTQTIDKFTMEPEICLSTYMARPYSHAHETTTTSVIRYTKPLLVLSSGLSQHQKLILSLSFALLLIQSYLVYFFADRYRITGPMLLILLCPLATTALCLNTRHITYRQVNCVVYCICIWEKKTEQERSEIEV